MAFKYFLKENVEAPAFPIITVTTMLFTDPMAAKIMLTASTRMPAFSAKTKQVTVGVFV